MPNYRKMARKAAKRYGLDEDIFERQINQESGFDEDVITGRRRSPAGALGIAQIMPATAKGWGVDPLDPMAALDAAAKNMARYVKKYGSYEAALRAYNAGPGNIERSKSFDETNHYVNVILNGRDPGKLTKNITSERTGPRLAGVVQDGSENRVSRLREILSSMNSAQEPIMPTMQSLDPYGTSSNLDAALQTSSRMLADAIGAQSSPQATTSPRAPVKGTATGGVGGTLNELFLNLPGAINVDESKKVGLGFVGGHKDHAHVAAGVKSMRRIAELAKNMGLRVGEYEPYDKVDPVHTEGSFHYRNRAADITGDAERLKRFTRRVAALYGIS